MTALTVDSAKNIAIIAVGAFVLFAIVSAWLIKNIVGKIISIVLLAGLSLGAWTQRSSLQSCAAKAKAQISANPSNVNLTCTFFGQNIKIKA